MSHFSLRPRVYDIDSLIVPAATLVEVVASRRVETERSGRRRGRTPRMRWRATDEENRDHHDQLRDGSVSLRRRAKVSGWNPSNPTVDRSVSVFRMIHRAYFDSILFFLVALALPCVTVAQYPPDILIDDLGVRVTETELTATEVLADASFDLEPEAEKSNELFLGADSGFSDNSSTLLAVEVTTGSSAFIGEIGISSVTDIATRSDGKVFGVTFENLLRIDCASGDLERVFRPSGFAGMNALAFGPDDQLYAATVFGELIKIKTNSGKGTRVGFFGGGLGSAGDLAFSPEGQLYGTARRSGSTSDLLISIDVRTGVATVIGRTRFRDVFGLIFGSDERLYGVANGNPGMLPVLIRINEKTGRGKRVGAIPGADGLFGLTSLCFE